MSKKNPTFKQKMAFRKTLENNGNVSKSMKQAGYGKGSAKNPKLLTDSDGWQTLMDKYFPDEKLAQVEQEGLEANRVISAQVTIKSDDPTVKNKQATARDVDFIDVPDHAVRHKFLETALKLKRRLVERIDHTTKDKPLPTPIITIPNVPTDNGDTKAPSTN